MLLVAAVTGPCVVCGPALECAFQSCVRQPTMPVHSSYLRGRHISCTAGYSPGAGAARAALLPSLGMIPSSSLSSIPAPPSMSMAEVPLAGLLAPCEAAVGPRGGLPAALPLGTAPSRCWPVGALGRLEAAGGAVRTVSLGQKYYVKFTV